MKSRENRCFWKDSSDVTAMDWWVFPIIFASHMQFSQLDWGSHDPSISSACQASLLEIFLPPALFLVLWELLNMFQPRKDDSGKTRILPKWIREQAEFQWQTWGKSRITQGHSGVSLAAWELQIFSSYLEKLVQVTLPFDLNTKNQSTTGDL